WPGRRLLFLMNSPVAAEAEVEQVWGRSVEFMQIDLDVVFLGSAAPGIHLYDAGNGQQAPLQYPILDGAEIGQTEMRRSDDLIAVDFADQTASLNLRRDI